MAFRIYKPDPEPEPIKEILARLFTARGWGRRQGRLHLEKAWALAVGPEFEHHTRVLGLRRGIFEIEVDSAVLVQELMHYHKRRLLQVLQEKLPGQTVKELRFKVGTFEKREE
jgi:predicted nucleic acid-binding Zn ribbon protein